jgi:hypothetical protein
MAIRDLGIIVGVSYVLVNIGLLEAFIFYSAISLIITVAYREKSGE